MLRFVCKRYWICEMRALVFIALLQTCACKTSLQKPRSVNLALETIVEFDNNENSADVQIIDKVRRFLDKVKVVIDKNKGNRRSFAAGKIKFTDFIKQVLGILSHYDDGDLEDVVSIAADEMRKYDYDGCKINELFENRNMRRVMASNLDKIKNAPAKEVKANLKTMLRTFEDNNFDSMQKVVVDYVNNLYGDLSPGVFKDVIDNLETYKSKSKRTSLNLIKIVRTGIRSVIFDHYSRLDEDTRRDLKLKLETFWNTLTNPGKKERHNVWDFKLINKKNIQRGLKDAVSASVEIIKPSRYLKVANKEKINKGRLRKAKRHRHESSKDKKTVTAFSDDVTATKNKHNKRHKKKSIKPSRLVTHMRGHDHKSNLERIKKDKRSREIIAEHEAVINVKKDSLNNVFIALDQLLGSRGRMATRTTMKERKSFNSHRTPSRQYRSRESDSDRDNHKITKRPKRVTLNQVRKNTPNMRVNSDLVNTESQAESSEGIPIKSFENDDNINSFRKSNRNDSLLHNITKANLNSQVTPDVNVLNRISELEKELRVVKQQIKVAEQKESNEPQYEPLDFWEGSATEPVTTTTARTTKITTTTKVTTTTKPTTITTTKSPTKILNNTFVGVFRTKNESNVERKMLEMQEDKADFTISDEITTETSKINDKSDKTKATTKQTPTTEAKKVITRTNLTNSLPRDDSENVLDLKNSAELDYFDDLKEPDVNMTGIADLERYLNKTKPIGGDDKTHDLVRKEMLERLKGIFPTPQVVNATIPSLGTMPSDVTSDPMNFLDVDEDILK